MAETVRDSPRLGWLDGLRGLAAMQVVLLHYTFAFLPALGSQNLRYIRFDWEHWGIGTPLAFLFNGTTAVYLFFIMSGVVLTYSFSVRPCAILPAVLRRLIRLGLPMTAALVLTTILFTVLPNAHLAAFRVLRVSWLGMSMPASVSAASIAHQIVVEGLLTGYREQGILPHWIGAILNLESLGQARNPPLWTLNFEFRGSLLVLALVAVRASVGRATYLATCFILAAGFVASPLNLFIVGHLAAPHLGRVCGGVWRSTLAGSCLILGVLLCTRPMLPLPLHSWLQSPPSGQSVEPNGVQVMLGAILVFASLDQLPILRRGLETPPLRWLGKISFSLYLTHFPVLFTVTAAVYTILADYRPYGASLAAGMVVGIAASLVIATLFERCIDRPAITLSGKAGRGGRRVVTPDPVLEAA